jgi:hypothetical protein
LESIDLLLRMEGLRLICINLHAVQIVLTIFIVLFRLGNDMVNDQVTLVQTPTKSTQVRCCTILFILPVHELWVGAKDHWWVLRMGVAIERNRIFISWEHVGEVAIKNVHWHRPRTTHPTNYSASRHNEATRDPVRAKSEHLSEDSRSIVVTIPFQKSPERSHNCSDEQIFLIVQREIKKHNPTNTGVGTSSVIDSFIMLHHSDHMILTKVERRFPD